MKFLFPLFSVLLLMACSSSQKTVKQPEPVVDPGPEWVRHRPIDTDYYIGIGRASKAISPSDYAQIAKRNALQDLVSEIEVKVESNSLLKQLETQTSFEERFLQSVRVQSVATVTDYELVGQWEDTRTYYIYYRLSKKRYLELKQQRIDRAVEQAQVHRQDAQQERSHDRLHQAFRSEVLALQVLKPFLNEPILITDPQSGREEYLGNVILQEMKELMRDMKITAASKKLEFTFGRVPSPNVIRVNVYSPQGNAQVNVPLIFECPLFYPDRNTMLSQSDGAAWAAFKRASRKGIGQLKVTVDMKSYFAKGDPLHQLVIKSVQVPSYSFDVTVHSPRVYLDMTEKSFGNVASMGQSWLRAAIQKALVSNGMQYEADHSKSHLIMVVVADTREAGEYQGLFTVKMEGEVTIHDLSNQEVLLKEPLNGIKGVDLDYKRAGDKAYEALKKKITYEIIPRLNRKLNGN